MNNPGPRCLQAICLMSIILIAAACQSQSQTQRTTPFASESLSDSTLQIAEPTSHHTPEEISRAWRDLRLDCKIPWRETENPNPRYAYIAQYRKGVGTSGQWAFKTQIECEMLGQTANAPFVYTVNLELWNERSHKEALELAEQAIAAFAEPPAEILEALRSGTNLKLDPWTVAKYDDQGIDEFTVTYRP